MKYTVIIPARYASTRLPGKPLADICGKSMIERVYAQAKLSKAERVIVATDHEGIANVVSDFGGDCIMTRADHESGTDRLAEVAAALALDDNDIVVNVQGDEPLIPPEVIDQVAHNLYKNSEASIATVSEPIISASQYQDPNSVKVVADNQGLALYFSRAPIPWHRDLLERSSAEEIEAFLVESSPVKKHIGIYAYKVRLLHSFVQWPVAALEKIEKLEQLRALANGQRIHVEDAIAPVPVGIDTPSDLERARTYFKNQSE